MRLVLDSSMSPIDGSALFVRYILLAQPWEELDQVCRRLPVRGVIDFRSVTRWIGRDVVLQRHRNVDQLACHEQHSLCSNFRSAVHFAGDCKPDANEDIMPAYWIARSKINDPTEYKKYTELVPGIIA